MRALHLDLGFRLGHDVGNDLGLARVADVHQLDGFHRLDTPGGEVLGDLGGELLRKHRARAQDLVDRARGENGSRRALQDRLELRLEFGEILHALRRDIAVGDAEEPDHVDDKGHAVHVIGGVIDQLPVEDGDGKDRHPHADEGHPGRPAVIGVACGLAASVGRRLARRLDDVDRIGRHDNAEHQRRQKQPDDECARDKTARTVGLASNMGRHPFVRNWFCTHAWDRARSCCGELA